MNISSSAPAALPLSTPGLAWCLPALLAVLLPTVIALNEPPSVTYYNQALAALGWGVWLCWLGWTWRNHPPALSARSLPMAALWLLAVVQVLAALWALWESPLPRGLAWMGAGLVMAAAVCAQAGWWCASQEAFSDRQRQAFFLALMAAGAIGMLIAIIQVFAPGWTDGQWLARPTVPGRAVGNLRQPNHFSSMLVMAMAACVWLGASRQAPARAMAVLTVLCVTGIVWSASRTGMVAMGLFTVWGVLDRQLPGRWRALLVACPLVYGLVWGGMSWISHLDNAVAFAAEARLHDGSDISSSRFAIWRDTWALIQQHPWTGVGFGAFNAAWTFTSFPDRPRAFFDHTHNLPLHWAVELGLPVALLLTALAGLAWWALVRPVLRKPVHGGAPTIGACALIVTALGLHSLLEYPLWYVHFLLPVAFAWGLGLGTARMRDTHALPETARTARRAPDRRFGQVMLLAGVSLLIGTLWNLVDYRLAAEVYAPWSRHTPLAERIATSQRQPWWGHQADYAAVTSQNLPGASPQPADFSGTLMNLIDARLMIAYARALDRAGDADRARAVADRLREFRNPAAQPFFAPCDKASTSPPAPQPFQCTPAQGHYSWQALLPPSSSASSRRQ